MDDTSFWCDANLLVLMLCAVAIVFIIGAIILDREGRDR